MNNDEEIHLVHFGDQKALTVPIADQKILSLTLFHKEKILGKCQGRFIRIKIYFMILNFIKLQVKIGVYLVAQNVILQRCSDGNEDKVQIERQF